MTVPLPPLLSMLPAGTKLVAGLGFATILPEMDFETYSEAGLDWDEAAQKWRPPAGVANKRDAGLSCVGACTYAEHATTEILTLSYDLKDGRGPRRWRPGLPPPVDLLEHIRAGGLIESHNAGFEFWIWSEICVKRYGWPELRTDQQRCSMAKARAFGLPASLDNIGNVLNITNKKDPKGKKLLDLFSKPRDPTAKDPRRRVRPSEEPAQAEELYQYCDTDIAAEAEVSSMVPDLSESELEFWVIDQKINRLGLATDQASVNSCIAIIGQAFDRYNAELRAITGGAVQAASELQKLKDWLATRGVMAASMDEEHLAELMQRRALMPADAARAIEIRALIGSASVKKLFSIRNKANRDGRIMDMLGFHGARTGRVVGHNPQPTNMPNSGPEVNLCRCGKHFGTNRARCPWCGELATRIVIEWNPDAVNDALEVCALGSLDILEMYYGDALAVVSACLRGMFTAGPGCDLISADYTAIEAVVLACLAGEQWRVDLFKNKGKIYEASGAKTSGLDYDEVIAYKERTGQHHPCRKKGKVQELALGYGGWVGALIAFGADEFMTESEMKDTALAWRAASPAIVEYWGGQFRGRPWDFDYRPELYGIEGAAVSAVMNPGTEYAYRDTSYLVRGDVLYCRLISGRLLAYHAPRLTPSTRHGGLELSFMGWNSNPKSGPMGWIRISTYGPKLVENIVQAVSRDILKHAIMALWAAGYKTVLHVYDEIVAEVPHGFGSVEEFVRIMGALPDWAADWPISAGGAWRGFRYRK